MKLRVALTQDALRIANLYQEVYEGTYPDPLMRDLNLMRSALDSTGFCWTVAEAASGELAGSVVYQLDQKNRLAKAFGAVVLPTYRGQKITEKLLTFGLDHMQSLQVPVEVIFATTRTLLLEPQKITSNLGYRKLGVFPNVHRTESYETHCLTAFFTPESVEKRFTDFEIHPDLEPIYAIARRECSFPALKVAPRTRVSMANTLDSFEQLGEIELEAIEAPAFVKHRFREEQSTVNEYEWFYPFHDPNVILTSADQSIEVFAYVSPIDQHCVLIGIRDRNGRGYLPILQAATRALHDKGARYIEFLMRADQFDKIEIAFRSRYIPSAYFPSMQLYKNQRYDFVVFSRSFEILDFGGTKLDGVNREYILLYAKYYAEIALGPVLRSRILIAPESPMESPRL